ncbi:MAG: LysM peptidoglycan-binding domain-containing protein [Lentisphaeria bacterium]|nr:LysM peptidoglycan-binding domain-containing protein [Lentisphaeria bacterium]NQZ67847.1 LysM peptidoglycan-binding domain-containing protein [Lentisphaeria bacterium]
MKYFIGLTLLIQLTFANEAELTTKLAGHSVKLKALGEWAEKLEKGLETQAISQDAQKNEIDDIKKAIIILDENNKVLYEKLNKVLKELATERKARIANDKKIIDFIKGKVSNEAAKPENETHAESKAEQTKEAKSAIYVVKSGDTLSQIARTNEIPLKYLKDLNDLKNDKIFAGQKLKVPADE